MSQSFEQLPHWNEISLEEKETIHSILQNGHKKHALRSKNNTNIDGDCEDCIANCDAVADEGIAACSFLPNKLAVIACVAAVGAARNSCHSFCKSNPEPPTPQPAPEPGPEPEPQPEPEPEPQPSPEPEPGNE